MAGDSQRLSKLAVAESLVAQRFSLSANSGQLFKINSAGCRFESRRGRHRRGSKSGPLIGLFLRALRHRADGRDVPRGNRPWHGLNGRLHRYVVTDLCDEDVALARLPERACEFCLRHDKMSMPWPVELLNNARPEDLAESGTGLSPRTKKEPVHRSWSLGDQLGATEVLAGRAGSACPTTPAISALRTAARTG
jgi:hypothetical protein